MRHRIERVVCPICRGSDVLRPICMGCHGKGEAIVVYGPGQRVEVFDIDDEVALHAQYPDEPTPVHHRATIAQAWMEFMRMVEITHVAAIQQREMKRAFYAGVFWMLEMVSVQLDPPSTPTADDLEYMQRIHAELAQFNEDVANGRA